MVHRNARLTVTGRLILVRRILGGRPVSHVAKEMGVSRQCAHRWLTRYRAAGEAGLSDRSSRPVSSPTATADATAAAVIELRSRKKLGRIPDGGGWRIEGPDTIDHHGGRDRKVKLGFDYVHVAVDDHSRLAFAQILPDEKGTTCAAFLAAAAEFFARHGIHIHEVMTDNAKNYTVSTAFHRQLTAIDAKHITTKPHCPWQNGKAERFNRTMQEYWAYRAPYVSNQHRAEALPPWLEHYNYARPHTACGGRPPISRVSPTS